MTGRDYSLLIARYLIANFATRGIEVYSEVAVGKSIIGKQRRVDLFVLDRPQNRALCIECTFHGTQGPTEENSPDEKIPYTLQDVAAMRMPACVVYAGDGWSAGVRHLLEGSEHAAFCLPDASTLGRTRHTQELDHVLAQCFAWWDLLLGTKTALSVGDLDPAH